VKAFHRIALSALGLMFASKSASAGVIDQLSVAERFQLDSGATLVKVRDMPGSAWPAVSVYKLVDTTPEVAMADFTDYNLQARYLKECCGLLMSSVLDSAVGGDRRVQRVLYEIEVPVVSNERYELREEMSRGEDGSYRVVWGKVSAGGRSESIFGRAMFEPVNGKTLFYYYNFTKITTPGAGFFAGESVKRTQRTVTAMARHMEQESAGGGRRLQENLARLREALGR
jgi:hypothetical protein